MVLYLYTDPTYKEWKRFYLDENGPSLKVKHGSYLQGMETHHAKSEHRGKDEPHGSYLQGMETK